MAPVLFNLFSCLLLERWQARVEGTDRAGIKLNCKYDQKLFQRYIRNADARMLYKVPVHWWWSLTGVYKIWYRECCERISKHAQTLVEWSTTPIPRTWWLEGKWWLVTNCSGWRRSRSCGWVSLSWFHKSWIWEDRCWSTKQNSQGIQGLWRNEEGSFPGQRFWSCVSRGRSIRHAYCCMVQSVGSCSGNMSRSPSQVYPDHPGNLQQKTMVWTHHHGWSEGWWRDEETVAEKTLKRRLEWLRHLACIPSHRIPKLALFSLVSQPQPRYGPRRRWRDMIEVKGEE